MRYTLQMLRALIEAHPDRAASLKIHVDALETTISEEPSRCLERVRALFEATHLTIAPHVGVVLTETEEFPARNSRIFKALDFKLEGHPEAEKVGETIKKLLGSINGVIGALAELSNIPGMRHGGSLDWSTLQRQHAVMLGGLCDTLVSFLFDIAWTRVAELAIKPQRERYEDYEAFNVTLDDEYGDFEIADSLFTASKILYSLDPIQYEFMRREWDVEKSTPAQGAGATA